MFAEEKLISFNVSSLLPEKETVHAILFEDGQQELPKANYDCPNDCSYMCKNSGLPKAHCACPVDYKKVRGIDCQLRIHVKNNIFMPNTKQMSTTKSNIDFFSEITFSEKKTLVFSGSFAGFMFVAIFLLCKYHS